MSIPTADGPPLRGTLHGGVGAVMAVQCHRLGGSSADPEATALQRLLASRRLPLLQLDFAGHGQSPGHLEATTYSAQMCQLAAALDYLASRHAAAFVLFGAGTGGSVALLAAARDERVVAVATLSAIGRPASHLPPGSRRPLRLLPSFAEDARSHDVVAAVAVLRAPILILHGERDAEVPAFEAEDLATQARCASLEIILGADQHGPTPQQLRPAMRRAATFLEESAQAAIIDRLLAAHR